MEEGCIYPLVLASHWSMVIPAGVTFPMLLGYTCMHASVLDGQKMRNMSHKPKEGVNAPVLSWAKPVQNWSPQQWLE